MKRIVGIISIIGAIGAFIPLAHGVYGCLTGECLLTNPIPIVVFLFFLANGFLFLQESKDADE